MVKKETVKTDTESRILQAAEEEFLLKGLEGARTTAIAERAGIRRSAYYFDRPGSRGDACYAALLFPYQKHAF